MRALVLSGGGSKGAFQAGVLKSLVDRGFRWDVIAGVSVGALNGAFLAQFSKDMQGKGADELKSFWDNVKGNKTVYKRWFPFGKLHALWKGSLFDTSPLAKTVKDNLNVDMLKSSGVRLMVGAVCLETGEYKYIEGDDQNIQEYVLASSAFPVAFTPRKIDGVSWVDGGVRDITPITDVLRLNPDQVDVILTGPLGQPAGKFPSKSASNGIEVALRTANLMADEVFNSDLDRVPEADVSKLRIFAPPPGANLSDPLEFDPKSIQEMYVLGLGVGSNG